MEYIGGVHFPVASHDFSEKHECREQPLAMSQACTATWSVGAHDHATARCSLVELCQMHRRAEEIGEPADFTGKQRRPKTPFWFAFDRMLCARDVVSRSSSCILSLALPMFAIAWDVCGFGRPLDVGRFW